MSLAEPSTQQVLDYEQRTRGRQAAIAVLAALLLLIAPVLSIAGPHAKVDELTLDLIYIHKRFPLDLISSALQALGLLALASTLLYLEGRSLARNSSLRKWIRWLALAGACLFAVGVFGSQVAAASVSSSFVGSGAQTYPEAYSLTRGGLLAVMPLIEQLGVLGLCAGVIFISLNAMRVGLLQRNVGYIGVASGALILFPILPIPIVAAFWLAMLAALFAGRYPAGQPPAWSSGAAEPWPLTERQRRAQAGYQQRAEMKAERQRQMQQRRAGRGGGAPKSDGAQEPTVPARTRSSTPKRKRKHR